MSIRDIQLISCLMMALCVIVLLTCLDIYCSRVGELEEQIQDIQQRSENLQTAISKSNGLVSKQSKIIEEFQQQQAAQTQQQAKQNRGESRGEKRTMEVTAYDLSYQSCGKYPDHPLYGITASGKHVEKWNTIAAGPELPFGTKVYIPYFKDKPNKGIFTVMDRGGAIKDGRLDVYMESYETCMEFGRQQLEVYILSKKGSV